MLVYFGNVSIYKVLLLLGHFTRALKIRSWWEISSYMRPYRFSINMRSVCKKEREKIGKSPTEFLLSCSPFWCRKLQFPASISFSLIEFFPHTYSRVVVAAIWWNQAEGLQSIACHKEENQCCWIILQPKLFLQRWQGNLWWKMTLTQSALI